MLHSSDRWKQIEDLFYVSLELPSESRSAFLDECCGTDTELRREVESLLDSDGKPMDVLQQSVANAAYDLFARHSATPIAPGKRLAHYEITSFLGSGGMGQVYLAVDTRLKRSVAIKILTSALTQDERALRRLEQEARAASALNHPNILTIYEFGVVDELHYIASEYVEGLTLRQKLVGGRLALETALDIGLQIASALETAHTSGVVHRDVKPENVVVRNDGLLKVLDFGIAKLTEAHEEETVRPAPCAVPISVSQAGMVIGSARYMSPEQACGETVDARSDIFGLGVVLYEMIAGRAPFDGQTVNDVIAEILKGSPPSLATVAPGLPSELQRIVDKAMCRDREARYQTIAEFSRDLWVLKKEIEFQAHANGSANRTLQGLGGLGIAAKTKSGIALVTLRSHLAHAVRSFRTIVASVILVLAVAGGYFAFLRSDTNRGPEKVRSLAILPFQNLKPDPATDFLGFSLADAVITELSYVNALTVRPSSAVGTYRNQAVDPQKVGSQLNVDTLLTGTFLTDGEDLRITAQLIDVKTDKILWRDTIDVKYDKLLTVHDRVSREIIRGLELSLSRAETAHLKRASPVGALAYEYYLRGVDLYWLNDFSAAISMLEKSVAMEPSYAPAWAHLGHAYATNASLHLAGREFYKKAEDAYQRALALDPSLLVPRIYLANLLTNTGRVEEGVPLLRRALQTNPNNAEAHWELSYAYRFGGMLAESVAEAERARGLDPQVKINSSALNGYLYLGQYEEFLKSLPVNNSAYILFYRGFAEYHEKKREQASRDLNRAYELDPTLLPAQIGKALSYAMAQRRTRGLEFLRETEVGIDERGVTDGELLYKVAQVYAVLADKTSSLRMLRRSIDSGFFCYPYFVRDPLLDSLRDQPGLGERMAEARRRHEDFKAKFF